MSEQQEGKGAMERMVSPVGKMSLTHDIDYDNNMLPLDMFIGFVLQIITFQP